MKRAYQELRLQLALQPRQALAQPLVAEAERGGGLAHAAVVEHREKMLQLADFHGRTGTTPLPTPTQP
jgi:hypothetical protein